MVGVKPPPAPTSNATSTQRPTQPLSTLLPPEPFPDVDGVWREADDEALMLNLSTLPALLTTPPLFVPLLQPLAAVGGTAGGTDARPSDTRGPQACAGTGGASGAASHGGVAGGGGGARGGWVSCVEVVAVDVATHRVHRYCGRQVVVEEVDWDMWDEEEEGEGGGGGGGGGGGTNGGGQVPEGGAAAPGANADANAGSSATPCAPSPTPNETGLWRCEFCKVECATNETLVDFRGHATVVDVGGSRYPSSLLVALEHTKVLASDWQSGSGSGGGGGTSLHQGGGEAVQRTGALQGRMPPAHTAGNTTPPASPAITLELEPLALRQLVGVGGEVWGAMGEEERGRRVLELASGGGEPGVGGLHGQGQVCLVSVVRGTSETGDEGRPRGSGAHGQCRIAALHPL